MEKYESLGKNFIETFQRFFFQNWVLQSNFLKNKQPPFIQCSSIFVAKIENTENNKIINKLVHVS